MKKTEERKLPAYVPPTVTVVEFRVEGGFAASLEGLAQGDSYGDELFNRRGNLEGLSSGSDYGNRDFNKRGGLEGLTEGEEYDNLF